MKVFHHNGKQRFFFFFFHLLGQAKLSGRSGFGALGLSYKIICTLLLDQGRLLGRKTGLSPVKKDDDLDFALSITYHIFPTTFVFNSLTSTATANYDHGFLALNDPYEPRLRLVNPTGIAPLQSVAGKVFSVSRCQTSRILALRAGSMLYCKL